MRLFIAVLFDDEILQGLEKVQSAFRRRGVTGNYIKKENLHLTLAFIGEYPDARKVLNAVRKLRFEPFQVKLKGIGRFSDLWWAGIGTDGELPQIAAQLRKLLAEADIPYDGKRFSPHITLVRRAEGITEKEAESIRIPFCTMTVKKISLMRSDRGKNGMIYTEIGAVEAQPPK